MKLAGWVFCLIARKHKRGVRVGKSDTVACPRCGATWARPPAKRKAVAQ